MKNEVAKQDEGGGLCQGFRLSAKPNFMDESRTFEESYSAEKVICDFGLHSRWHRKAALPSSLNRAFKTVNGSIDCELPMVNLFSKVENL